ncbi:MAG: bifunctional demethylmenaquinone methyltransferase/2-methoxy-6-polyprenyl-1,4-benzoquinol methylase UbiE [Desulfomonilaceae bacterium]
MKSEPLQTWPPEKRVTVVKAIFNTIAPHYDLINRVMSVGRDVAWRKFVIKRIPRNVKKVLDVATGTGDLAICVAQSLPNVQVLAVDFVVKMMRLAQSKTQIKGLVSRIEFIGADAIRLPFEADEFDVATMAFGLRNVPHRLAALEEIRRVVRPGGKVITLEMTFPKNIRLRSFLKWYLNHMVPVIGGLISGNKEAYRYLPDSIQDFLTPDELSSLFESAGFKSIKTYPLTFGLTYLHEGIAT